MWPPSLSGPKSFPSSNPTYVVLASNATKTTVCIGWVQARREMDSRVGVICRFGQLDVAGDRDPSRSRFEAGNNDSTSILKDAEMGYHRTRPSPILLSARRSRRRGRPHGGYASETKLIAMHETLEELRRTAVVAMNREGVSNRSIRRDVLAPATLNQLLARSFQCALLRHSSFLSRATRFAGGGGGGGPLSVRTIGRVVSCSTKVCGACTYRSIERQEDTERRRCISMPMLPLHSSCADHLIPSGLS